MKRAIFLVLLFSLCLAGMVVAQDVTPPSNLWQQIPLDGAICARGTPYSFFVHDGSPDKLMIYFQGGGLCWNADTCQPGGPFDDTVDAHELDHYHGIFDFANPQNPVADYSFVFVSYCTGDSHSGSTTRTYDTSGENFTIHFNGFNNAQAVLNWTFAHFKSPSELLITGSSAGSFGAIFNAPYILSQYPEVQAVVLGDAGVGLRAAGFDGLVEWGTAKNIFENYGALNPLDPTAFYTAASLTFPNAAFAEYTTATDEVQSSYYVLEGGLNQDWEFEVKAMFSQLNALKNFHSYLAWGNIHSILPRSLFYTMQVSGVPFHDWFANLIGGQPVTNIQCKNCQQPELTTGH